MIQGPLFIVWNPEAGEGYITTDCDSASCGLDRRNPVPTIADAMHEAYEHETEIFRIEELCKEILEVDAELEAQVKEWGQEHDDKHVKLDWSWLVNKYNGLAIYERDNFEKRMIQVAAIAVSAVKSHRRIKARFDKESDSFRSAGINYNNRFNDAPCE